MDIKGLTDRGSAFPEIGSIRKGKMDGNRPIDLKYFRVEFAEEEAQNQFNALYKNDKGIVEPTEISVVFPFNEIDRNWEAWLEAYTAGRMVARSDGEKMIYQIDTKTGEVIVKHGEDNKGDEVPMPKNYKVGTYKTEKGQVKDILLKPVGRLKVVLPELKRLAYVTVHTTSYHDIINISQQLEALREVNNGRLAGIYLTLRRRPRRVSCPDTKDKTKKVRREKWLLSIEADHEWAQLQFATMRNKALPEGSIALLTGRVDEMPDIIEPENIPEEISEDENDGITDGEFSELDDRYTDEIGPDEEQEDEQSDLSKRIDSAMLLVSKKTNKKYGDMSVDELTVEIETATAYKKKNPDKWTVDFEKKLSDANFLQGWMIEQQRKP